MTLSQYGILRSAADLTLNYNIECLVHLFPFIAVPPAISIHPMYTSIIEFTDLLSFCNASGQPRPIIRWRRKDKEMMFPPGEYLSLPNVSRDDTGLYECIAKNSAGKESAEFRINVLCKFKRVCKYNFIISFQRHEVLKVSFNVTAKSLLIPPVFV